MAVAFWSIKLEANGPKVDVQPPENYVLIVTLAALDFETPSSGKVAVKVDTEAIDGDHLSSIIGTLGGNTTQFNLNLALGYDVVTKFSLLGGKDGKGSVYLSGYYQPAPDDSEFLFSLIESKIGLDL